MAYKEENYGSIARLLDWSERLPKLISVPEDRTSEFAKELEAVAEVRPEISYLVLYFNNGESGMKW